MPTQMLQVIPQTLVFTPTGGTAVSFTDFADPVAFTYEVSYNDIASQSSDYPVGQLLVGRSASVKAVLNKFDLGQAVGITSGVALDYTSASDTLAFKAGGNKANEGALTFTGLETASGKTVTVTVPRCVASVSGDISFGRAEETKLGVMFKALKPTTGNVVTIAIV